MIAGATFATLILSMTTEKFSTLTVVVTLAATSMCTASVVVVFAIASLCIPHTSVSIVPDLT